MEINNKIEVTEGSRTSGEIYRSDRNQFVAALSDVLSGIVKVPVWSMLAWEGFVDRYRRSYIGAAWATLSFMVFALAILFFLGAMRGSSESSFTQYTVIGFLLFQWLSALLLEGAQVFVSSSNWIKAVRLPMSVFVMAGIVRTIIVFLFNAIGALIILLFSGYVFPETAIWAVPGLLVVIVNAFWIYLFFGTVVAKFRDVFHIIQTFMRMAFFITPIMWTVQEGTFQGLVALLNPLTHFIDIVRAPLLGEAPPLVSWQIVGGITGIGYIVALIAFSLFRRRVRMWL